MDLARNPAVCDCSINYHPFGSFSPDQIRIVTMNIMQYATRVDAVLRCGLERVDMVRTGSIRILIRNWNPCKNFWTWPKKFFSLYHSHGILRNWHGLRCGSMRVKPGRYGFDTVWTRFEIWLCVNVAYATVTHTRVTNQIWYGWKWAGIVPE
jgi:hypothetical protein